MKQNKDNQNKKQRSGFAVMCGLIGMIKPLLGIMCLAILMGCAGNLMATFLTILGGYALLTVTGVYSGMKFSVIFTLRSASSLPMTPECPFTFTKESRILSSTERTYS